MQKPQTVLDNPLRVLIYAKTNNIFSEILIARKARHRLKRARTCETCTLAMQITYMYFEILRKESIHQREL
jgi:hypothetical protein